MAYDIANPGDGRSFADAAPGQRSTKSVRTQLIDQIVRAVEDSTSDLGERVLEMSTLAKAAQRTNKALVELIELKVASMEMRISGMESAIQGVEGTPMSQTVEQMGQIRIAVAESTAEIAGRLSEQRGETARAVQEAAALLIGQFDDKVESFGRRVEEMFSATQERVAQESAELGTAVQHSASQLQDGLAGHSGNLEASVRDSMEWVGQLLSQDTAKVEVAIQQSAAALSERMAQHSAASEQSVLQSTSALGAQVAEVVTALEGLTQSTSLLASEADRRAQALDQGMQEAARSANRLADSHNEQVQGSIRKIEEYLEQRLGSIEEWLRVQFGIAGETMTRQVSRAEEAAESMVREVGRVFEANLSKVVENTSFSQRQVAESNTRIEGVQRSLVRYLAERDERMELARNRVFADLVDRMTESLGRRARSKLGAVLGAQKPDPEKSEYSRPSPGPSDTGLPADFSRWGATPIPPRLPDAAAAAGLGAPGGPAEDRRPLDRAGGAGASDRPGHEVLEDAGLSWPLVAGGRGESGQTQPIEPPGLISDQEAGEGADDDEGPVEFYPAVDPDQAEVGEAQAGKTTAGADTAAPSDTGKKDYRRKSGGAAAKRSRPAPRRAKAKGPASDKKSGPTTSPAGPADSPRPKARPLKKGR